MRKAVLLLVVCAVVCLSAGADVVYSNFASGDTFDTSGWAVSGPSSILGTEWDRAVAFRPTGDYFLDEVDLALGNTIGTAHDVIITGDNSGVPGSIIEQTAVTAPGSPGVVTAYFAGTTQLSNAVQYWVWLSAPGDGLDTWQNNLSGDTGLIATTQNSGPWTAGTGSARPSFRVEGTLVPEPGTFVLLGLGAVGLVLYRRRKQ